MPTHKEELAQSFGSRLAFALSRRAVSRRMLATAVGVTESAVGQVLSGKSKAMAVDKAAKAAEFLRVDSYWLATGEGEWEPASATPEEMRTIKELRVIRDANPELHQKIAQSIHRHAANLRDDSKLFEPEVIRGMSAFGGLDVLPAAKKPKRHVR